MPFVIPKKVHDLFWPLRNVLRQKHFRHSRQKICQFGKMCQIGHTPIIPDIGDNVYHFVYLGYFARSGFSPTEKTFVIFLASQFSNVRAKPHHNKKCHKNKSNSRKTAKKSVCITKNSRPRNSKEKEINI